MFFVQFHVFLGTLALVYPYKTDTWPPWNAINKHYNVPELIATCSKRSGVDLKEVAEFETTPNTDLELLPNSHALKVYLNCLMIDGGTVDQKLNKLSASKFGDLMEDLTKEEAAIYLKWNKGCPRRLLEIKDRLEYTYMLHVCWKQNDNEHFYIVY